MIKKILTLGLMISLLFSLVGCNQADVLVDYKDIGKITIQTHAETKVQNNYSTDNWMAICNFITTGKAAVEAAKSKHEVDAAVATAKARIDDVALKGEITFQVGIAGIPQNGSSAITISKLVREHAQLISTFEGHDISWENDIEIWERYDNNFFNDKALILQVFWAYSGSTVYSVKKVRVNGEIISINLLGNGASNNDDTYLVTLVIEVCKSDISDAEIIDVDTHIEFARKY